MGVNLDKPQKWNADIARSVDMYNDWFMDFAPKAFGETRIQTTKDIEATLHATDNLTNIRPDILRRHPEVLPTLRMSTCPPIAVNRLIGLAKVPGSMVKRMENEKKLPVRMGHAQLDEELRKIGAIIEKMADPDIFVWLGRDDPATEAEIRDKHNGVTLGDLFRIKRGLATGDNRFFILTREQIEQHELPWEFFEPILPSARYLKGDHIKADAQGN